jgi:hypothetical protein
MFVRLKPQDGKTNYTFNTELIKFLCPHGPEGKQTMIHFKDGLQTQIVDHPINFVNRLLEAKDWETFKEFNKNELKEKIALMKGT